MKQIKEKPWAQILIIYSRYLLGGAFVFASLIKLKGERFTTFSGAEYPINSAWHLFETLYQSGLYWKFIGLGQVITGFLLMTQRYAKLGALLNLPIMANVFIITLSYYFAYTPLITALMLIGNVMLVLWHWNELKVLVNLKPDLEQANRLEKNKVWEVVGLLLFLFTFTYRLLVNKYDLFLWLGVCILIGSVGFLYGWRRRNNYA